LIVFEAGIELHNKWVVDSAVDGYLTTNLFLNRFAANVCLADNL
jgi:hypothetical protein